MAPANALLDPGETWNFTCPGIPVAAPTVNTATIIGQPSGPDGVPLPGIGTVQDDATAFVDVLRPGIDIVKTALVPSTASFTFAFAGIPFVLTPGQSEAFPDLPPACTFTNSTTGAAGPDTGGGGSGSGSGTLPATGIDPTGVVRAAVAMLLAGAAFLALPRTRRRISAGGRRGGRRRDPAPP